MADIVTFDPVNRRIVPIDTLGTGDVELNVVEIYSEWKTWVVASGSKAGIESSATAAPAFRYVGADPISDTQNLGTTFFMLNGWRIRPFERNHKLTLVGNIFTDPAGSSVFVNTIGAFTVNTETRVSNLVDSSVARLDLTQLLPAVYIDVLGGQSGSAVGRGTPTAPVNNIADAFIIANRDSLQEFRFRGTIKLDRNAPSWNFVGLGSEEASVIIVDGYDIGKSHFENLTISGSMIGRIQAERSKITLVDGLAGVFRSCGLTSDFTLASGSEVIFSDCFSEVAGGGNPICHFASGSTEVNFRNWSGGLEFRNMSPGDIASVDLDPGRLILDSSCTDGICLVRGHGQLADSSTGTTVLSDGLLKAESLENASDKASLAAALSA